MIDDFDTEDEAPHKHPKEYHLYAKYHRMANTVERHFIENMGMEWKDYQKAVYNEKVKVRSNKKNSASKATKRLKVR
jgi:hypothetical protein